MCSHREQARGMRSLGVAFAEQRDEAMREGDTASARMLSGMGKAHLRAAEILEGAAMALETPLRLASTPACEGIAKTA